jgi:preprotein translocase subunit YajC
MILIGVIFYLFLIKPQQKKAKEQQLMVNSLKVGNNVCTTSGIMGKVKKINNKEGLLSLEIATGVEIQILKASVNKVLDSAKVAKVSRAIPSAKAKGKKSKK